MADRINVPRLERYLASKAGVMDRAPGTGALLVSSDAMRALLAVAKAADAIFSSLGVALVVAHLYRDDWKAMTDALAPLSFTEETTP